MSASEQDDPYNVNISHEKECMYTIVHMNVIL